MITPTTYIQGTTTLGHYSVAQQSGIILGSGTPTTGDPLASFRWAPSNPSALAVLMRVRLGWAVVAAVTTATRMAFKGTIARGFTVDFSSANTQANLAAKPKTGSMRSGTMAQSLLGTLGPQICTTAKMTGQTYTLDADAFAMTQWSALESQTVSGTAVLLAAGTAGPMQTLYEWTGLGQHPLVLSANEGVMISPAAAVWADGSASVMAQWEWAEVLSF